MLERPTTFKETRKHQEYQTELTQWLTELNKDPHEFRVFKPFLLIKFI